MPQLKTPLLQAGENAERYLGRLVELSVFQAGGVARGLPSLQKSANGKKCLFLLDSESRCILRYRSCCGVLNYLVWTKVGHMSVCLIDSPFASLCCVAGVMNIPG